ncbi:hypothetical protein [Shewanella cyperi]|uniref:Uncharacterized protein n=1 Tax=Shewanella cyperi TaxID=2814292 RepID=A0A975AKC5_9GAMM|nr:hypothetical protein [Shewanella cyperi]QSX29596.1 hypothetical protein JYB88_15565 [Shewanella cyperi]QSX40378.1 hypothetical protein JYB84_15645 [Shewanella cyperi]
MFKAPLPLRLLILLYLLLSIAALARSISTGALDLFTLGVIPVVVGLLLRTAWSEVVLKLYIAIQTLGFAAFGVTAILALQITPQDVKVELLGYQPPFAAVVLCVIGLLAYQYWVAFSASTKAYLRRVPQQE